MRPSTDPLTFESYRLKRRLPALVREFCELATPEEQEDLETLLDALLIATPEESERLNAAMLERPMIDAHLTAIATAILDRHHDDESA